MGRFIRGGRCVYCSETLSENMVEWHLQSCSIRMESSPFLRKGQNTFLLEVIGKRFPEYWLFVEVNGDTCKLKDIDRFLRSIWLECCGHLSSFRIENQRHESHPDFIYGSKAKSMQEDVNRIFKQGMIFGYTYDFGSSTELLIKVVSATSFSKDDEVTLQHIKASKKTRVVKGRGRDKSKIPPPVSLVARNDPIVFTCYACKKAEATSICTICLYEKSRKGASLCDGCVERHKCGEDMFLPIVNSPRSGECGYTGN